MRASIKPLSVGVGVQVGNQHVRRTGTTSAVLSLTHPITPYEVTNLNAALSGTGIKVEKYWRWDQPNVGWSQPIGITTQGKRTEATNGQHFIGTAGTLNAQPAPAPVATQSVALPAQPVVQSAPTFAEVAAETFSANLVEPDDEPEYVTADDEQSSHEYIPIPKLRNLFAANVRGTKRGKPPKAMLFLGPSGCGKTDGAAFLAAEVGLPFLKVDAASMVDAESWFGSREVTAVNGASVTTYIPSAFVLAIQKPGLTLIDEANRVRDEHRNVINPLTDGTRRVMNPLTGQVIQMHPEHYLVLSGNRGLAFTGTYAMDPALLNRCLVLNFDYLGFDDEVKVAREATGCDDRTARLFVRFANDIRALVVAQNAQGGTDLAPISTRQIIAMCDIVHDGLDIDEAVEAGVINAASEDGGDGSVVGSLTKVWTGIRPLYDSDQPITLADAKP